MSGIIEFSESFEGGTNGATITSSNTGFNPHLGSGTGTFDSTFAADGTLSAKIVSTGAGGNFYTLQHDFGASKQMMFVRLAVYMTAWPSGNLFIGSGINGGTHPQLRINSSGIVSLLNNNAVVASTAATIPTTTWFVLEWNIDVAGTTQSARLYTGLTGAPVETISGLYNLAAITGIQVGITATLSATVWIDAVADAFDDWVGPFSDTPAAGWLSM